MEWGKRVLAVILVLSSMPVAAQTTVYPNRSIRLLVGLAPGGGTDICARIIAPRLQERLRQPVIVENRPGAGGNIAADMVAKAAADGYTTLLTTTSLVINAALPQKLPFDLLTDFEPVATIVVTPFGLFIGPSMAAIKNVQDLIATARSRPGRLTYGSAGIGTPLHLGMEILKSMTEIDMVHVPYKALPSGWTDLLESRIDMIFASYASAGPHLQSGKVRMLAAGGATRMAVAPDVPTIMESGVSGFAVDPWFGFAATGKTPQAIIRRLAQEMQAILAEPETREKMATQVFEVRFEGPEIFKKRIQSELALWSKTVKDAGIKAE